MKNVELKLLVEGEGGIIYFGEMDRLDSEVRWNKSMSKYQMNTPKISNIEFDGDLFETQKRLIELVEEDFPDKNYTIKLDIKNN